MQHLKSTDCPNFENFKKFFKNTHNFEWYNPETKKFSEMTLDEKNSDFFDIFKIKLSTHEYTELDNFYSTLNSISEEKIELYEYESRELLKSIGITFKFDIVSYKDGLTKFKIFNREFLSRTLLLIINEYDKTFQFDSGKWTPISEYYKDVKFSQFRLQTIQRQINQEVRMK
jgi:hypothetical protein